MDKWIWAPCKDGKDTKVVMEVAMDNNSTQDSSSSSNNTADTNKTNSRLTNHRSNNSSNSKVVEMEILSRRYSELSRSVSVDDVRPVWFDDWMYKTRGIWRDDIDEVGPVLEDLGSHLTHVLDELIP